MHVTTLASSLAVVFTAARLLDEALTATLVAAADDGAIDAAIYGACQRCNDASRRAWWHAAPVFVMLAHAQIDARRVVSRPAAAKIASITRG